MLQICTIDTFRLIVTAARRGAFGPFGVIQGCLDMGDQEHTIAKALLEELEVSDVELGQFIRGYQEHQAAKRSAI